MEKNESILLLIFSTENEKIAKTAKRNKIEFLLKNLMKTRRDIINCDITVLVVSIRDEKREKNREKIKRKYKQNVFSAIKRTAFFQQDKVKRKKNGQ